MGVVLILSVWMARYLGPEQFGQLNYAIAFVSIFAVIAALGINEIVVRDIVQHPSTTSETIGSAFLLGLIGSLLAISLAFVIIFLAKDYDEQSRMIITIIVSGLFFKSTNVFKYWFEAQVNSRYVVWLESTTVIFMAFIRILLILFSAPLIYFAWTLLFESIIVALGLIYIYRNQSGNDRNIKFSFTRMKTLVHDSWPLLLSGIAIMIYMRIDQIMLGEIINDKAVGIYTVAVQISEAWYFFPIILVSSLFPSIINAKKDNEVEYYNKLQRLYKLIVIFALIIAIPTTFLSDWIIQFLFGSNYSEASTVLTLHIWTGIFVGLGIASGKWYILEDLKILLFYRTIVSAFINVVLNFILIPNYGVRGAAVATLISFIVASFLFDAFNKKTRKLFYMKTKSLLLQG